MVTIDNQKEEAQLMQQKVLKNLLKEKNTLTNS